MSYPHQGIAKSKPRLPPNGAPASKEALAKLSQDTFLPETARWKSNRQWRKWNCNEGAAN